MWCAKCQSEVAVEARPNSQRLHCATCGSEILPKMSGRSSPLPPANPPQTPAAKPPESGIAPPHINPTAGGKNPQELLARWAGNQMFDAYGPLVPPEPRKEPPREQRPEPPKPEPQPAPGLDPSARLRVDPAFTHGWSEIPPPHVQPIPNRIEARPPRLSEQELPPGYRAHAPAQLRGPHFHPSRMNPPPKSIGWIAWFGQILAYVGAATLTVGAGMVMVGYLGGPNYYAPTGWFTTTVGQMLLFLGVVTLVSAGMDQTTVEVATRIDTLGEQLNRMEYQAQAIALADDDELQTQLRAEIAQLRQQLSEQNRGR